MVENNYVEKIEGNYFIRESRVSLDSVVYRFLEGLSPETIQSDCFPTLSLEQVYGGISYYLANRSAVDAYLSESDDDYESFRQRVRAAYPEAHRRFDAILTNPQPTRS